MITATSYFLARLHGSTFYYTWNSYLSLLFTFTNFAFLAHATITTKSVGDLVSPLCYHFLTNFLQADTSARIRFTHWVLVALYIVLAFTPFFPFSPLSFFFLVLLNAAVQAAAGSYLQTAVAALASLFGSSAIQVMYSGQAIVAIVVSIVQYAASAASMTKDGRGTRDASAEGGVDWGAVAFFAFCAIYFTLSLAVYGALTRTNSYKTIMSPPILQEPGDLSFRSDEDGLDRTDREAETESEPFLSPTAPAELQVSASQNVLQILRTNWIWNSAVAYIFVITLVRRVQIALNRLS